MADIMPPIGFGLWKIAPEDTAATVVEAVRAGYRHFDSAADYANEAQTGEGLAQAIEQGLVTRDELWVTGKLWNTFHAPEHVEQACRKTLADLRLDYLDLYLIHFPIALKYVPIDQAASPRATNPCWCGPAMCGSRCLRGTGSRSFHRF